MTDVNKTVVPTVSSTVPRLEYVRTFPSPPPPEQHKWCNYLYVKISIGIWTAVSSIILLGIFGWQTKEIKYYNNRNKNTVLSFDNSDSRFADPERYYYESYYEAPNEALYTDLIAVQIINLVSATFLFITSIFFIIGSIINRSNFVLPWFATISFSIASCMAYAILWWSSEPKGHWLTLSIVSFIFAYINGLCLVFVVIMSIRYRTL